MAELIDGLSRPTSHKRIVAQCFVDGKDISKEWCAAARLIGRNFLPDTTTAAMARNELWRA